MLTDGVYSFEETVSSGLSYSSVMPEVGKVYSADALITVSYLYEGTDPSLVFYAPLTALSTEAETGQPLTVIGSPAVENGAVSFPSHSYMQCETPLLRGASEFTMFFIVKSNDGHDAHIIKDTYQDDYWRVAIINRYNGNNELHAYIRNSETGSTGSRKQVTGRALPANIESAIALVYSASEIVLYADGERIGSSPGSVALLNDVSTLYFGSTYNSYSPVTMRQFYVFNRALTDAEVIALTQRYVN